MIISSRRLHFYVLALAILLLLLVPLIAISISVRDKNNQALVIDNQIESSINEILRELSFSNTQEWDDNITRDYRGYARSSFSPISKLAISNIKLPNPPTNDSEETVNELETLHLLQSLRVPAVVAEIELERNLNNALFGNQSINDWQNNYPNTVELLNYADQQIIPVVVHFKEKFDRVRPNFLDTSLTTTIETPGHPSYPSGHSSQSYLTAHILSLLDPQYEDQYFNDAKRIAHNREIAGVHYPSDSEAGKILAEEFFELLRSDRKFFELLNLAKEEF